MSATNETPRTAVFLDQSSVDQGDLDLSSLERLCPDLTCHPSTSPGDVMSRVQDAEIVLTNKVVLNRDILTRASKLKLVCITATGSNNLDLEAARELGIQVTNVTDYATSSVVQHVFAMILTLVTRLDQYRAAVNQGAWQSADSFCLLNYPIEELAGKRLGIVGYGVLGKAVARVAEAFGMEVLLAQRPGGTDQPGRIGLAELLPMVDILLLHCPLTEQTRNLIGKEQLASMKPHALLINTARGGIVEEQALADALINGTIGGAGVDVLTVEPPRQGNPLLNSSIPNLILTPHTAWAGRASRQRLINEVTENIRAFLSGVGRNRLV